MSNTTTNKFDTLNNNGCKFWDGAGGRYYVNDAAALLTLIGWRVDDYKNVFDDTGKCLSNNRARKLLGDLDGAWFDVQADEFQFRWTPEMSTRSLVTKIASAIA